MRNHYVPCLYLKGFTANPNKGRKSRIWVYDKENHKSYPNVIEKVAMENNYYNRSLEAMLTKKIESPANPIFEKIRRGYLPDSKEKSIISIFINVMITRVPHYRKWLIEKIPEALYESQTSIEEDIKRIYSWSPKKAATELNNFKDLAEKTDSETRNQFYTQWKDPFIKNGFVSLVSRMKWVFYYVNSWESKFITSDNPVTILKKYGLFDKGGKLFFPISKNICLVASKGNEKETFLPVLENDCMKINQHTACNATRFIYYHEEKTWVKKL